jgi:hypothetical protein
MPNDQVDIFVAADDILRRIDCSTLATLSPADYDAARQQYEALRYNGAAKPAPKRRERKPTLASVAKQASRAGIEVARYEVEAGKITVVTGKPGEQGSTTTNEWDEVLSDGAASKIH